MTFRALKEVIGARAADDAPAATCEIGALEDTKKRRMNPLGGAPLGNLDNARAAPTDPQDGTKAIEADM